MIGFASAAEKPERLTPGFHCSERKASLERCSPATARRNPDLAAFPF
jgi:hypothetical protein